VKVCSLYGAGYYYIPGTDVCVKIGGYVRADWSYHVNNPTNGPWAGTDGYLTRTQGSKDTSWRSRAYISMDTRQQTAYGTLRTYFQTGINTLWEGGPATFNSNRAFIQIAGFTVGLASSYFDFFSGAAVSYLVPESSDTGDGGRPVFAYTAQLGNGISATLSLEEPLSKSTGVSNTSTGAPAFSFAKYDNNRRKAIMPDVVANLRVSQAWGAAQIMGALHEVAGGYYGTTLTGAEVNGHPSDKWGWAVGAGLRINMPMIAPGDYLQAQVAYAHGATRYVTNTVGNQSLFGRSQSTFGYGIHSDGIFRGATATSPTATGLELTTSWGVAGSFEHYWTPSLRTSIKGSYVAVSYNATANDALCAALPSGITINAANTAACNNNFQTWSIGSRTQWNVTKDFYMGFDVMYYKLQTASRGAIVNYAAAAGSSIGSGVYTLADQDTVVGMVRWHRDIAP
jgi:hypothetical protein